jgi:hypothetical protein
MPFGDFDKNPAFLSKNSLFSDIGVAPIVGNLYYHYESLSSSGQTA